MKQVIKFKLDGKEGFLSMTTIDGHWYTLAEKLSTKVDEVNRNHKLSISTELAKPVYIDHGAHVLTDSVIVQRVFEQLKQENNLYFKELNDTLCVIEIIR